ncbi:MAG: 1-acyl-sn-glycerol-3-phosphate acyltransferase [Parvularcula sp.]
MSQTHKHYSRASARPAPYRGVLPQLWHLWCLGFLKLTRWRIEGDWPRHHKMVVVAAPHTSNWDGIYMLAAAGYYRAPLKWMGKKSLTTGPLGGIVKWLGCVPIDRSSANDVVGQMCEAFDHTEKLMLLIPPEGTRSRTEAWKTGFYHIAHQADVPIVMSVLDFGTRTIRVSGEILPSGDYGADLPLIQSHYADAVGKRAAKFAG